MRDFIKKALTRTVTVKGSRGKTQQVELPPSEHIVYLLTFSIYAFIGLTILEIIHMIYFGVWNSEIFSAVTGLIGTITGIFISQRA